MLLMQQPSVPTNGTPAVDGAVPNPRRKAPLRYASRAVINNTYMRRICRDSVEKYKQTANEVYRATVDRLAGEQQPAAVTLTPRPDNEEDRAASWHIQPPPALMVDTNELVSKSKESLLTVPSPSSASSTDSASSSSSSLQLTEIRSPVDVKPVRKPTFEDDEECRQSLGDVDSGLGGSDDTATSERLSSGPAVSVASAVKHSPLAAAESGPRHQVAEVSREEAAVTDTSVSNFVSNQSATSIEVKSILRKACSDSTGSTQPASQVNNMCTFTDNDQQKAVDSQQRSNETGPSNSVRFHPLALLLDAALEGDLELVKVAASQVTDVSEPNDEGITALHNAVCAGRTDIADFLVRVAGADVNAGDTDGWTPLHCAASCGNLPLARLLVEHGAALHARTLSDQETAMEKCDQGDEQADCEEYLFFQQERLGSAATGRVYALFPRGIEAAGPGSLDAYVASDELPLRPNEMLTVIDRDPANEIDWVLAEKPDGGGARGLVPRSHISCYPLVRVPPASLPQPEKKPSQRSTTAPLWWWSLEEAEENSGDGDQMGMLVVVGPEAGDNYGLDDEDYGHGDTDEYGGEGPAKYPPSSSAEDVQQKGRGNTTRVLVQLEPASVRGAGDAEDCAVLVSSTSVDTTFAACSAKV